MESESSSPKRSASEDPAGTLTATDSALTRSPRAQSQDISHLSLSDPSSNDIDAYMASQGEDHIEQTAIFDHTPSPAAEHVLPSDPHRSPAEREAFIDTARKRPLREGDTWYVISQSWFKRWRRALSGMDSKEGGVLLEKDVGPVDNATIITDQGSLMLTVEEGIDYQLVPEDAWALLVRW